MGVARAVSTMQGITALLATRLTWWGPPSWESFIAEQTSNARLRDARIGALLEKIAAQMRAAGVACVGLKGAALRRLGLYRLGERPMGDVDLLVRSATRRRSKKS
jgi:hypothetical protein